MFKVNLNRFSLTLKLVLHSIGISSLAGAVFLQVSSIHRHRHSRHFYGHGAKSIDIKHRNSVHRFCRHLSLPLSYV